MPAFFLAFLSVLLSVLAGREAVRVARLAGAGVPAWGLVLAATFAGGVCAAISAVIGDQIAPVLNPKGARLIAAIALAVAAGEVLLLRAKPAPKEPTLSVGAAALVLAAALLTGAAGLLVIAITLVTGAPLLVAMGGASGAVVALTLPALSGSEWEHKVPQSALRWTMGSLLGLAAVLTGLPVFVPVF